MKDRSSVELTFGLLVESDSKSFPHRHSEWLLAMMSHVNNIYAKQLQELLNGITCQVTFKIL